MIKTVFPELFTYMNYFIQQAVLRKEELLSIISLYS